jgi:hypothetical protein
MQVRDAYPATSAGGCCFVTRNAKLRPGERVVDLDVDIDTLPAFGRLCVSETGVALMADALGFTLDPRIAAKVKAQRATIRALRAEADGLREALRIVADAVGGVAGAVPARTPLDETETAA